MLHHDPVAVGAAVASAGRAQGTVEGKLAALGFEQRLELAAEAWSQEAVAMVAIEGERLLDIMDDAVTHCADGMTDARLHTWQAVLFPTGYAGQQVRRARLSRKRQKEPVAPFVVFGPELPSDSIFC